MMNQSLIDQLQSDDPVLRKQAIIAAGRAGNREALPLLAAVYKNDPVPELRQLAQKAGRAIQQGVSTAGNSAAPIAPAGTGKSPAKDPVVSATPPPKKAAALLDKAFKLQLRREQTEAAEVLAQALHMHPGYAQDERFRILAAGVLKISADEAVRKLTEGRLPEEDSGTSARNRRTSTQQGSSSFSRILLVIAVVVLVALAGWFVQNGYLEKYITWFRVSQIEQNVQHLANGREYFVVVPGGSPPENGWGVVVAMHGNGGDGKSVMVKPLLDMVEEEGVILVAPTFGNYDSSVSLDSLRYDLNAILDAVAEKYTVNPYGAVLYGFSRGGMFATQFLDGYSHRVVAIVADAAPDIVVPPAGSAYVTPCHFVYGENDGLYLFTGEQADQLRNAGFPVTFEVVPNAGHEMTRQGMDWVREMVRSSF